MIDELREEEIVNKVGGRYKLSTLIQKRLIALNAGARPLVNLPNSVPKIQVVIEEIMQNKIYLDMSVVKDQVDEGAADVGDLDDE